MEHSTVQCFMMHHGRTLCQVEMVWTLNLSQWLHQGPSMKCWHMEPPVSWWFPHVSDIAHGFFHFLHFGRETKTERNSSEYFFSMAKWQNFKCCQKTPLLFINDENATESSYKCFQLWFCYSSNFFPTWPQIAPSLHWTGPRWNHYCSSHFRCWCYGSVYHMVIQTKQIGVIKNKLM